MQMKFSIFKAHRSSVVFHTSPQRNMQYYLAPESVNSFGRKRSNFRRHEWSVHSNGKSNVFVMSVYISVYFLFRLFLRVVRRGGGGGSVKGVRGPVRKVVHGPGP